MDNNEEQEQEEEYYDDYNIIPDISFIRIGIGLTQQISQEEEEPMETMTYYKKMHKLYHELKNRK